MNNVYTALSLALLGSRRFVLTTNDYEKTVSLFRTLLEKACQFNESDVCEIDVKYYFDNRSMDELVEKMISWDDDIKAYTFRRVVIWRNMEKLTYEQQKDGVFSLLNQIDEYDTNASRYKPLKEVDVGSFKVRKPQMFTIVSLIESEHAQPKIYQYVKEKFWFTQNFHYDAAIDNQIDVSPLEDYAGLIMRLRTKVRPEIYTSPDIQRYIYSLVVHARNHRLCSLAPIHARLSTRAIDSIKSLAECMVVWKQYDTNKLYVTPDYCKIAMRKIGNWLIDWEYDSIFSAPSASNCDSDLEHRKQLEISMLTGDWYGSDWNYVKQYLDNYKTDTRASNYVNKIVEDTLKSVQPPL